MAGTLTFPIERIAALARHTLDSKEFTYGYDVMFDPAFHKGGKVVEKDGWPDKDNLDKSKLKPALLLVKDHGVYVMGNGVPEPSRDNDGHVAYANEANPKTLAFDDWWYTADSIMGGDDTVMTLFGFPELVLRAQAAGATAMKLRVTQRSVSMTGVFPRAAKKKP